MKKHLFGALAFAAVAFTAGITFGAIQVRAGDLGGSCCVDLEERVAELEATAANKGNRKQTLTVYGQVSKSILWVDGSFRDGRVVENGNSPSRFGFVGEGKVDAKTKVGYQLEIGAGDTLSMRHANVWIEGTAGKLTIGRASTATDGISEIAVANTNIANLPSAVYGIVVDGSRKDIVRYDTASFGGLKGAVSYAGGDTIEAAATFVNEAGGFKYAAGIGYAEEAAGVKRLSGSASAMHNQTGIFGGITAGQLKVDGLDDVVAWHLTGGIEQKFNALGKTTFYAEYGRLTFMDEAGNGWGLGVVQNVEKVAADVFASYRRIEDINVLGVGARVKF